MRASRRPKCIDVRGGEGGRDRVRANRERLRAQRGRAVLQRHRVAESGVAVEELHRSHRVSGSHCDSEHRLLPHQKCARARRVEDHRRRHGTGFLPCVVTLEPRRREGEADRVKILAGLVESGERDCALSCELGCSVAPASHTTLNRRFGERETGEQRIRALEPLTHRIRVYELTALDIDPELTRRRRDNDNPRVRERDIEGVGILRFRPTLVPAEVHAVATTEQDVGR